MYRGSDSSVRTYIDEQIPERSTFWIDLDLVALSSSGDEDDMPSLASITMKLMMPDGIIIRNVGDVSSSYADGHLHWVSEIDDARIIGNGSIERHIALVEWTWDSGNRAGRHEVVHTIANLVGVTTS